MLQFSRHFFALFLLVTVLPLLSLLLWSNYELEQNKVNHQKHMLSTITRNAVRLYQNNLRAEINEITRITSSLSHNTLNLQQYGIILGAKTVTPLSLNSAELSAYPALKAMHQKAPHQVHGGYIQAPHSLKSVFIIPASQTHPSLLIQKTVDLETLFPQGPVQAEAFQGASTHPSQLLARSHPLLPPPGEKQKHCGSFSRFLLEGASPPPPSIAATCAIGCSENIIQIPGLTNTPALTLRLRMHAPPRGPGQITSIISVLILLTGIISSLLAGRYIHHNFIRPLLTLSDVTSQVKQGNLSARIETQTIRQPDVKTTLENFNTMMEGLLEKEQLRKNFISNLTHDFRTPLIAQSRSLELLSTEFKQLNMPKEEQLAISIVKNNAHLLAMVNQLLENYQTDSNKFVLNQQLTYIPSLIHQCFEQLLPLAEERHIQLTQAFSEDFPDIEIDDYYIKRVLINLIANAIQNIPKHSKIHVKGLKIQHNQVEIHVQDNGAGISEEEQQHIFDHYYAGTGDTRKLGSGLGLYICKLLVEAHHGSISVQSGEGETNFIVQLPILKKETLDEHTD